MREMSRYEFERRLRCVLEPFEAGSAYGRGNVERHEVGGGVSRSVSCLAQRSKERATAADVRNELNEAHRRGVALGIVVAGPVSYRQAWSGLMVAAFFDVATVEQCETFASLSADRLGYGHEERFEPRSWFWRWSDEETVSDLFALFQSAVLLEVSL